MRFRETCRRYLNFFKKVLAFWEMMYYNHFCVEKMNVGNALLAQLVEHLTLNQGVQGSSPWQRTGRS